jgi:hypothetical protein
VSLRFIRTRKAASSLILCLLTVTQAKGSTPNLCPSDRPCFTAGYQSGSTVIFQFNGIIGWDYYNVRYETANGYMHVENRSGRFSFKSVRSGRKYTLSVQGYNSGFLASSSCSPWSSKEVITR